jgi:hypothetical protein
MGWLILCLLAFAVTAGARALLRGGSERPDTTRECLRCKGSGRVRMPMAAHKTRCPSCGGRGRRPRNEGAWS